MRMRSGVLGLLVTGLAACRPSDILSVPPPAGVVPSGGLANQSGAENAFAGAKGQLFTALDGAYSGGLLSWSELLTDEFTFSGFAFDGYNAGVDARITAGGGGFFEFTTDSPWGALLQARSAVLLALPNLAHYEPPSARATVGEAYALVGYAELVLAESYCAGTTLDGVVSGGGLFYGTPLTTDSLLGVAVAHFDSAVTAANGDATVLGLASVGLGRALVDRGEYSAAATAVANVPTGFVYNVTMEPNLSAAPFTAPVYGDAVAADYDRYFNVADQEGGNGLNFISAHDPRLTFDTSLQTLDGVYGGVVPGTWYLPTKFEADLADIPLATGIEARLIEAENQLPANPGMWLTDLNALRTGGCSGAEDSTCSLGSAQVAGQASGLVPLADPGSDSARVSLLFRERAFWLFGTGARLGDLRRLIRQYGRDAEKVFPTGPYPNGNNPGLPSPLPNYGTDVNITLPTFGYYGTKDTNPNYKGCITSTKTA
jgi:hypothetical protein